MKIAGILLITVVVSVVTLMSCYPNDDCPDGINKLPMYGRAKKCAAQIENDARFLRSCDEQFKGDRKAAAKYYAQRGWDLFYKNKPDTAMMRFNQAWLLDSLNAHTYWGFANLTGMQGKYVESIGFFDRAIQLDPSNAKIHQSAVVSYGQLYTRTHNEKYIKGAIEHLKAADSLDKGNARIYTQLAGAYLEYTKIDSAKKYLRLAETIDPNSVDPQLRSAVTGN